MHPALLPAAWPAPKSVHGFTTLRHGAGISQPPFDSFNLGLRSGDDETAARRNRHACPAASRTSAIVSGVIGAVTPRSRRSILTARRHSRHARPCRSTLSTTADQPFASRTSCPCSANALNARTRLIHLYRSRAGGCGWSVTSVSKIDQVSAATSISCSVQSSGSLTKVKTGATR